MYQVERRVWDSNFCLLVTSRVTSLPRLWKVVFTIGCWNNSLTSHSFAQRSYTTWQFIMCFISLNSDNDASSWFSHHPIMHERHLMSGTYNRWKNQRFIGFILISESRPVVDNSRYQPFPFLFPPRLPIKNPIAAIPSSPTFPVEEAKDRSRGPSP